MSLNPAFQEPLMPMPKPPRKAKRLRELALKQASTATQEYQLPIMPVPTTAAPPVHAPSSSPRPVSDAAAAAAAPSGQLAPRRRGRKPAGSLSKSAREQLRKTNHSVIEKRRREKINEALAALRQLVPNDKQSSNNNTPQTKESSSSNSNSNSNNNGKDVPEREFKLEVLVRTVDYLRKMMDRMKELERGVCGVCSGPLQQACLPPTPAIHPGERRSLKRKRAEDDEEEEEDNYDDAEDGGAAAAGDDYSDAESEYDMLDEPSPPPRVLQSAATVTTIATTSTITSTRTRRSTSTGERPEPSPPLRLPSISSWIGDMPVVPAPTPTPTPTTSPHVHQLPSPPQSAPFPPTDAAISSLPSLSLPPAAVKFSDEGVLPSQTTSSNQTMNQSESSFRGGATSISTSITERPMLPLPLPLSSPPSNYTRMLPPSPSSPQFHRPPARSNPLEIRSLCHSHSSTQTASASATAAAASSTRARARASTSPGTSGGGCAISARTISSSSASASTSTSTSTSSSKRAWSGEDDQTAVSLLLNISSCKPSSSSSTGGEAERSSSSSSASSTSSSSTSSPCYYRGAVAAPGAAPPPAPAPAIEVYTPRSMLGMPPSSLLRSRSRSSFASASSSSSSSIDKATG